MTQDEINQALNRNSAAQLVWTWNLSQAIAQDKADDIYNEAINMLAALELEENDLDAMLADVGNGE